MLSRLKTLSPEGVETFVLASANSAVLQQRRPYVPLILFFQRLN